MNLPVLPIAVGAGVALVLGVLLFSGKAKAAPPPAATKTPAKKATGGGGGSVSKPADWKMIGYKAGLAQGKADKAKGSPYFLIPSRVVSGPKMPGTPGSTTSDGNAVANWTAGYADGYPLGFGKIGSTTPKYAVDAASEDDGSGTMDYTDGGATVDDSSSSDSSSSTDSTDTSTSGTPGGYVTSLPVNRPIGAWGPRQTILAKVKSRRAA